MIAIDTNLLVYAHRSEMPFHERARQVLNEAIGGTEPVCIPWPCAHEFLGVVSNPRIFKEPTPIALALQVIGYILENITGGFLAEGDGYLAARRRTPV